MITKVATHSKDLGSNCIMLTNANEVLSKDGIHGRIAPVGKGFGTGRHTANAREKRSHDYNLKYSARAREKSPHLSTSPRKPTRPTSKTTVAKDPPEPLPLPQDSAPPARMLLKIVQNEY